jgi:hypothetical protein
VRDTRNRCLFWELGMHKIHCEQNIYRIFR